GLGSALRCTQPVGPGGAMTAGQRSNGSNGIRRVVVTGMGAVTALGPDVESTWASLVAGRSGVRTITSFNPERLDSRIAAEVVDFDPSAVVDRKDARRMDRYIQFGLVVARE